jgi:hypothetical protein
MQDYWRFGEEGGGGVIRECNVLNNSAEVRKLENVFAFYLVAGNLMTDGHSSVGIATRIPSSLVSRRSIPGRSKRFISFPTRTEGLI